MEHRTERLEIIMGRDDYWHDLITEPDIWEMPMEEKISVYGGDLAKKVALGEISVKHLRQAVRLTNMLEAEVHHLLEPYAGDVMSFDSEERLEAEYRWFAHHVFKDALGRVKSQSQRIGLRNRVKMSMKTNLGRMPGMGRLEGHDIQALREEAEKVE